MKKQYLSMVPRAAKPLIWRSWKEFWAYYAELQKQQMRKAA